MEKCRPLLGLVGCPCLGCPLDTRRWTNRSCLLLENMYVADIHYHMLNKHKFKTFIDAGLATSDRWNNKYVEALTSRNNNGLNKYSELLQSQERIYADEERNLDSNIEEVDDGLQNLNQC
mmetsp:Transcript_30542/g.47816  ORF Transcript_30542/g.47816 Transcript_30542/m.47816 type:complete len:120 (+) Transcript_30542:937-1296(+)